MQVDAESAINPYIFIHLAGLAFFYLFIFFENKTKKHFFSFKKSHSFILNLGNGTLSPKIHFLW